MHGPATSPSRPTSLWRRLPDAAAHRFACLINRSIRSLLLMVLLVALVPGVVLQLSFFYQRYEERREDELQANLEMARAVAVTFDAYIQGVLRQELAIGTALAAARGRTPAEMSAYLAANARRSPAIRNFGWISPDGVAIASGDPEAIGISIADRPYFREILAGKEWAVSDLLQSRLRDFTSIFVVRGIRDGQGVLKGVVLASIDPDRMAEALRIQRDQEGALAIFDRQGRRVYRYPEIPMTWEQRQTSMDDAPVREALAGREATATMFLELTNDHRISAGVPIPSLGWAAVTGRPEEEVLGPLRNDLMEQLTLLAMVALSALAAALALGRSLTDPIRRLRTQAAALGQRRLDHRAEVAGPVELRDLAAAFNRMADELRQHEEDREIFIQMMSHDLRTPLTSLLGQAQLLHRSLRRAGADGGDLGKADAIVTSARRLNAMIQDLVDSARLEAGQLRLQLRPLEMRSFVSELTERLAGLEGAERIRIVPDGPLPPVAADPDRLERVLTNLLSNALKYSAPGTEITVRVEQRGSEVVTIVEDRGPGIAPDDLPHLFQRYRRTRRAQATQEGLGLGLYITRGLVEAQGGRIWAESAVGQGSRFCFTLPVTSPARPSRDGPLAA